jgi:arginase
LSRSTTKPTFATIDVPSNLGLRPSGVERLPDALHRAGLAARLGARDGGRVEPAAAYDATRAADTGLLNGPGLHATLLALAQAVESVVSRGDVPIVLAGDCSVILGGLLGLRRARRAAGRSDGVGLLFVDGHVDFYQPEASPTGEVADMDLALATGRGPALLAQLDGPRPLVREPDVAAVGARDAEERARAGAQDVRATVIRLFELEAIREHGMSMIASEAVAVVAKRELSGFWLHLDADVLDDTFMHAVDYRQPGGLMPEELTTLLRVAADSSRMGGVSVAIYNPELDPDGAAARTLVDCLVDGFVESSPP